MDNTPVNDAVFAQTGNTSFEIVSPVHGSNKVRYTRPNGKEVLVLLSGKMQVRFPKESSMEIPRDKPVVVEKPYNLYCPEGPGTGRALRITVKP